MAAVKRDYGAVMAVGGAMLRALGVLEVTGVRTQLVQELQTDLPQSSLL
jgi:hypothetical protein